MNETKINPEHIDLALRITDKTGAIAETILSHPQISP